jgi:hypothetical protein
MQRLAIIFLLLVLPVSFTGISYGTTKKNTQKVRKYAKRPLKLYYDTSNIHAKSFDANAIKHFKANKEFDYTDYSDAGDPSILKRIFIWIWQHLFGWMHNVHPDGTFMGFILVLLKYLIIALFIAALIFFIIKAFGLDPIQLFRGSSKKIDIPYTESVEDINTINFDEEIEKAIAQKDYRIAVRLLYLRSLKQLSDMQLIHWQIDKTNSAYVNELADPSQKQTFSLITRQFEYVWYGNFMIDKQAFVNIALLFQDFKQQLPS